jgi:hypothetical protein
MNREMRHGTAYAYNTKGCRCDECRTAASARGKASNAKRRERGLPEGDSRHGTYSGYVNWSCRCRPCTNASMDYQRRWHTARGPSNLRLGLRPRVEFVHPVGRIAPAPSAVGIPTTITQPELSGGFCAAGATLRWECLGRTRPGSRHLVCILSGHSGALPKPAPRIRPCIQRIRVPRP